MNTLKIKTINDIKISKIKTNENKNNYIVGYDYFNEPFSNIFLLAKKKSGKTTLIYNILKHTGLKNKTKIIIICSTINKDATYEKIKEYCDKNYPDSEYYDDINIDKENIIKNFIQSQKSSMKRNSNNLTQETENIKGGGLVLNNYIKFTPVIKQSINQLNDIDENNQKDGLFKTHQNDIDDRNFTDVKSSKKIQDNFSNEKQDEQTDKIYPEYIIVIDDLGIDTRDKNITQLLKTNRHYKCKVILSSQNLEDLQPAAIRNLDYILLFGSIPEEKILKIRDQLMLDIDKDKLLEIYKIITSKKYNFLYIDIRNEILRENFNKQIDY